MGSEPKGTSLDHESLALLVHELRGPLTVIVGYLDLLERPLDDEERSAVVGAMRRAALRLDRMLDDVTEGRGPTCPTRLSLERIRVRELVEGVAADWATSTGRDIRIEGDADSVIEGDEHRLEAALGNLLSNSGKYSPPESPIVIRLSEGAGAARICVEDSGPGIPAGERDRVLARFERLERDDEKPGSGLGLAVVRETAEAHGGAVMIGVSPSGGAAITMELPLALR